MSTDDLERGEDFAPEPNETRFEDARAASDLNVLPCGHDEEHWQQTSEVRYNKPPNPSDGVLAIRPGECSICETPVREFYSGEIDGPFLGREEFEPDAVDEDVTRHPNARIVDLSDVDETEDD